MEKQYVVVKVDQCEGMNITAKGFPFLKEAKDCVKEQYKSALKENNIDPKQYDKDYVHGLKKTGDGLTASIYNGDDVDIYWKIIDICEDVDENEPEEDKKFRKELVEELRSIAEEHYDLEPQESDSISEMLEKFFFWCDEYNEGYFCCLETPENELSEFERWLVKKSPIYMKRFSYEDNEDDE